VRIREQPLLWRGDAYLCQRPVRHLARRDTSDITVRTNGFDQLRIDAQHRIQRHHRILEDHCDAVAANGAHSPVRQAEQVAPPEKDPAAGNPAGRIDQPHDGIRSHRLAGTRFTNQSHNLPGFQRKRDVVERPDYLFARRELRGQVLNGQHRCRVRYIHIDATCSRGFNTSRS
jgi:hypothetical protein